MTMAPLPCWWSRWNGPPRRPAGVMRGCCLPQTFCFHELQEEGLPVGRPGVSNVGVHGLGKEDGFDFLAEFVKTGNDMRGRQRTASEEIRGETLF